MKEPSNTGLTNLIAVGDIMLGEVTPGIVNHEQQKVTYSVVIKIDNEMVI